VGTGGDEVTIDGNHPLAGERAGAGFGRGLYLSDIARFLEDREEVDYVVTGPSSELANVNYQYIETDACCGLIASAAHHAIPARAVL